VRAVLFDFDYTLADSSAAIVDCFDAGLASLGLAAVAPERVRHTIGLPLRVALERLAGAVDAARFACFLAAFQARAEVVMTERATVFDPVAATVGRLRAAGLATAICTTKRRVHVERILARHSLSALFDTVAGADEVALPKPAPDVLLAALARLGVEPARAVYVGDHPVDAEAAARAGVAFVAVLTGPSRADAFASHPVRSFLASLAELPAALRLRDTD
jgi:phosphoglycolate phosphatase